MKHIVSTSKAILSGLATVFFLGYACFYLSRSLWLELVFFVVLGLLFARQFYLNTSYIKMDKTSLRLMFAGLTREELLWADVKEVGVIGEAVFSYTKKGKSKTGEKFIYVSPIAMNEQSRFQMILNWPPKAGLYMEYTYEVLEHTQVLWKGPVKYYNVEELAPTTKD